MKQCIICNSETTQQWYTGPKCKACYRKQHRENHLEEYKARDKSQYEINSTEISISRKTYYKNNAEIIKAKNKQHRKIVGDQHRPGYKKKWLEKNPEKSGLYNRIFREKNPEKARAHGIAWHKRNPEYAKTREANRRAFKLQATPKWLTKEQKNEIREIYKNCPKGFDVDHIIPLKGKIAKGLHVPWNLQYLPASENRRKGNKI